MVERCGNSVEGNAGGLKVFCSIDVGRLPTQVGVGTGELCVDTPEMAMLLIF